MQALGVVSAKLSARPALATSGALPEKVNYAVKSGLLISFLESCPKWQPSSRNQAQPSARDRKFEDVE